MTRVAVRGPAAGRVGPVKEKPDSSRARFRAVDDGSDAAQGIYAATLRLMEEHSFEDLSVAQITAESGVSRTTFYFYFSSKFSVLAGLLAAAMGDIEETVEPFLVRAPEVDAADALELSIREVTRSWHRHRRVLQATSRSWYSDAELGELWLRIVEWFIDAGVAEVEREREAGLVTSAVGTRALVTSLFWGTERILHVAGLGIDPDLPDEEAAVEPLVAMWRGTLYGS